MYESRIPSADELDALFDADRLAAATIAETVMMQQISSAVSNITEINQVANVRIQADCAVASARISADAEVCAAELVAQAEMALMQIRATMAGRRLDPEKLTSMVTEIGRSSREVIASGAEETISAIKRQAESAIEQITGHARTSIEDIKALADEYADRVRVNAEIARRRLQQQEELNSTPKEEDREADDAAESVLKVSSTTTKTLKSKVAAAIHEINTLTAKILEEIAETVEVAESRIHAARDRALAAIRELVDMNIR